LPDIYGIEGRTDSDCRLPALQKAGLPRKKNGVDLMFGNKSFQTIALQANRIMAIANSAQFNPEYGCAGAKKAIEEKVREIEELLKDLPE
jgi:hypothetical protein